MAWQGVPYTTLLMVMAAMSVVSVLYIWLRYSVPGSKTTVLIGLAVAVWMVGYALELRSVDTPSKDFWNKMQYLGIVVAPTAWLVFMLQYTGRQKWLTSHNLLLLSIEPLITLLLVFTNETHGLIWKGPVPVTAEPFSVLIRPHGVGWWIHTVYTYTLLLITIFLLVQMLIRSRRLYRRQASLLLFAALLPVLGNMIMQLGWNLFPYLDPTPLAFTLSSLTLTWSLFHLRRGDIMSVSRGAIFTSMSDGVIVLDAQNCIMDLNPAARRLIGVDGSETIGQLVEQVWPEWPGLMEINRDGLGGVEVVVDRGDEQCIYDVSLSPLFDWRDQLAGQIVVLRDITARKQAEEALRRAEVEARRRLGEQTALREASTLITSTLDLTEVLSRIAEQMANAIDVTSAYICNTDLEKRASTVLAEYCSPHACAEETVSDLGATYVETDSRFLEALSVGQFYTDQVDDPDLPEADREHLMQYGARSALYIPLFIRGQTTGYAELWESRRRREFTSEEIALCQAIGQNATIAIENARLYEEAQRQARELAVLNRTGQTIASTLDLNTVLRQVMTEAMSIVDAESASVMLHNLARDELEFFTILGPASETLVGTRMPATEGIAGWVVREKQLVVVPDAQSDPRFYDQIDAITGLTTRSLLAVPLECKDRIIGVIEAINKTDGRFGDHDRSLLSTLAGSAAVAIENARLYEETARRLAETRVLQEVMLVAASILDFDLVLERTIETLQATLQVEFLGFALPDEEGEGLRLHPAQVGFPPLAEDFRLSLDGCVCGQVYQTGTPMLIGDVREIPYYHESAPEARSGLAVPVFVGGHVIGVLNVESRRPNDFSEEDLAFYMAIAGQLGVALENARLYQEVRRQADELMTAVTRLQELDRLKSEFMQNVSHELRTPLALLRGYAEVLDAGELGELQPEQRGPVAIIAQRARTLTALVGDITLIMEVEINPPEPEPVLWDELTWATIEDLQTTVGQTGLTLRAEIAPDLPPVNCTHIYLRRVLDTLVNNAIKFTPAGGAIIVRLRQEEEQVALEVSDTGIGIPSDQLERVFERFYQVDGSASRRYSGVGLGLALVKEIVEAYDGCVTVQSQVGKGSTFTVTLPAYCK